MAALTGTATPHTLQIIDSLKLQQCTNIKNSFLRENLFIEVLEKKENSKKQVAAIVQEKFQNDCGIVYCARRQDAVDMAQELKKHNITVTYVHGTLSDLDRKKMRNCGAMEMSTLCVQQSALAWASIREM